MRISPRIREAVHDATSVFQSVPRFEYPRHHGDADEKKRQRHRKADAAAHIRLAVEGPAKSVDEINDRVEQPEGAPELGQHGDRVDRPAEEGERRDDQHRDEAELLETQRPDAKYIAEQTKGHQRKHKKTKQPNKMLDVDRHEQMRGRE